MCCDHDRHSCRILKNTASPTSIVYFDELIDDIVRGLQLFSNPFSSCLAKAKHYADFKPVNNRLVKRPTLCRQIFKFCFEMFLARSAYKNQVTRGNMAGFKFQLIKHMQHSWLHAASAGILIIPLFMLVFGPFEQFIRKHLFCVPLHCLAALLIRTSTRI